MPPLLDWELTLNQNQERRHAHLPGPEIMPRAIIHFATR
jgi:hypothetical protein